jgi:glycosyltransferase involved in cell wall biosynthesis
VIGSGAAEAQAAEAAAAGGVVFHGRLPRDRALAIVASASVSLSVQTARYARNRMGVSPLKVAEGLMLGVPTVVSDLPGQAQLVRDAPMGEVVPPDDPGQSLSRWHVFMGHHTARDANSRTTHQSD